MDPKKDIFSTSEGKWNFTIALIVIAIFSVLLYQFLYTAADEDVVQVSTKSIKTQTESTISAHKDEKHQYLYTNSNTYQAKSIQAEDAYDSDVITAVVISDIKDNPADSISKPINEVKKTTLVPITQKKVSESIATSKLKEKELEPSMQPEEEITPEPLTQLVEETIPEIETIEPAVIDETETITANSTTMNCVVIVGVFKKAGNKAAIIEKLKSLGHTHSEGVLRKGLNYVGVPVACDNEQVMQKLLRELNQAFGIDSWVKKV